MPSDPARALETAESYYDSPDADAFYREIWGGEDIHIGLYRDGNSIAEASRSTVAEMASRLSGLQPGARVLDLGAGYGGAARFLAREFDVHVTCINLSNVENERNKSLNSEAGLDQQIDVVHAAFESPPVDDNSFDIVWSQDAFLHSGNRRAVLAAAVSALKHGGELIFTDPMQADDLADASRLKPIYERIHLDDLASIGFYRAELKKLGMTELSVEVLTEQLVTHYGRVAEALTERSESLSASISRDYVARMLTGLGHWVTAGKRGDLQWGILHFRKDGQAA